MKTSQRRIAGTAAAVVALAVLAPTAAANAASSPSPKPSLIGANPGTWTPIRASKADSGKTFTLVKDQAIVFDAFSSKAKFTSSDSKVFVVANAEGTGTYTASAGGHATGVGHAVVTVRNNGKVVATFTVHVK